MNLHSLLNDAADRHSGVQAGVGVLENHLVILLKLLLLLGARLFPVLSLIQNLSGGFGVNAEDGAAQRGLAAAGLSDQAQGLSFIDIQRDPVHRLHRAFVGSGEIFAQILYLKQHLLFHYLLPPSRTCCGAMGWLSQQDAWCVDEKSVGCGAHFLQTGMQ